MEEQKNEKIERREKNILSVKNAADIVRKELTKEKFNIVMSSRKTMQNLALISGTLAAGSLVMLSSPVSRITSLILIGICILLFEVFYIFKYLFDRHEDESLIIKEIKENVLDPLDKILINTREAEEGKITWEESDKLTSPLYHKLSIENKKGHKPEETGKSYTMDNMPSICMWLTGIGLILIGLGLILPYLLCI